MSYESSIAWLYSLQMHGIKLGLDNPRALLLALGSPERAFRSIHVAGTNGKGTASACTAAMLSRAGSRTGLYTSPHLIRFTERMRVDGVEIADDEVVRLAGIVREVSDAGGINPTFFEVVTAMGFEHFRGQSAAWAVVETGMGGRLDATNIVLPEVAIITSISLDHKDFLGATIREIAGEKAGIIKPNVPLVVARQDAEALRVIEEKALELGASVSLSGRDFSAHVNSHGLGFIEFDYSSDTLNIDNVRLPLTGRHQAENAAMAIRAIELVYPGLGSAHALETIVREGLAGLRWPGRMDILRRDPLVVVDGAHNPKAAQALAETVKTDFPEGNGLVLVAGAMADKDVTGILMPLLDLADSAIFTSPDYGRAAKPEELACIAGALGYKGQVSCVPSVAEALRMAMLAGKPVLVTGSFFIAGEAMEALGDKGFHKGLRE